MLKAGTLLSIVVASVALLGMTGRGLSGIYLIGFITFLLAVFMVLVFLHDKEITNYQISDKLILGLEVMMISVVVIFWISIIDFYFVETFKNLGLNLKDNTYWVVFFGGLIPIFFSIISVVYFLGSFHFSNTIRILAFFAFLSNSNLNDFLYYILLNQPLPSEWTWIYQPAFLFGNTITSPQLLFWTILSLVMGLIAFLLPYEALTTDYFDDLSDEKRSPKEKRFQLFAVLILSISGIIYAYSIIPKIKMSIDLNSPIRQAESLNQSIKDSLGNFPRAHADFAKSDKDRIELSEKIVNYLNNQYADNKHYPISSGNCINDWDSSFISLPFTLEDGRSFHDPDQVQSHNCDFTGQSKNILYYSDGKRFALLMPGETIADDYKNIYIPAKRDVYWFNENVGFFKDWKWDVRIMVFMYERGKEVTTFTNSVE